MRQYLFHSNMPRVGVHFQAQLPAFGSRDTGIAVRIYLSRLLYYASGNCCCSYTSSVAAAEGATRGEEGVVSQDT